MKHFTTFLNQTPERIAALVQRGIELKSGKNAASIRGKNLGMVFFNPSLRTRVSFETAMFKYGGNAVSLSAGGDTWTLETKEGAIMDGTKVEHIKDAAPVLSRYCDAIGIRTFAGLKDIDEDLKEEVIACFAKYATVPVISLESAMEHPCQALADMMTAKERFKETKKKTFVLTWAPHIKPRPMAVPHSALLAGAYLGCEVIVAHPKGYDLPAVYMDHARSIATSLGGSVTVTNDQSVCAKADILYAKNWIAAGDYGKVQTLETIPPELASWKVTKSALKADSIFLHCLPVRRNVEVADEVLDAPQSAIYDEAENRMWAQAALLEDIFKA